MSSSTPQATSSIKAQSSSTGSSTHLAKVLSAQSEAKGINHKKDKAPALDSDHAAKKAFKSQGACSRRQQPNSKRANPMAEQMHRFFALDDVENSLGRSFSER